MNSFGDTIRKLREDKALPLRTVAAYLDIDQAILSKVERGKRNITREQVIKLATYFKVKGDDLIVAWLADKLMYNIADEDMGLKALQVAEESVAYNTRPSINKAQIIKQLSTFFKKDGRIAKAWIFGSFARNDFKTKSDIDLMVRFTTEKQISLFDYADISYLLEQLVKIKVDIVEEGYLEPFAWETAKKDLQLIYE